MAIPVFKSHYYKFHYININSTCFIKLLSNVMLYLIARVDNREESVKLSYTASKMIV